MPVPSYDYPVSGMLSDTSPPPLVASCLNVRGESPTTGEAWNAFDKGPGFLEYHDEFLGWGPPVHLDIDLGAGNAVVVVAYRVQCDLGVNGPNSWYFLGSNDGANWDMLDILGGHGDPWTDYEEAVYPIANLTAYRFYRLSVNSDKTGAIRWSLRELTLMSPTAPTLPVVNPLIGKQIGGGPAIW